MTSEHVYKINLINYYNILVKPLLYWTHCSKLKSSY